MHKSWLIISFFGELLFEKKELLFKVFLMIGVTSFIENLAYFTYKLFIVGEGQSSYYIPRKKPVVELLTKESCTVFFT